MQAKIQIVKSGQVPYSDAQLIQAIARGEEDSLALFYDRYSALVFGLLLRILNSRIEAEDVLQQVFLEVWRCAADFDQTHSRPSVRLITLAHRLAIDRRRSLTHGDSREMNASYDVSQNGCGSNQNAIFSHSQQREKVCRVLNELPQNQRRALLLAYFEGLTLPEISAQPGERLVAVKTGLRAGLMKLRNASHVSLEIETKAEERLPSLFSANLQIG